MIGRKKHRTELPERLSALRSALDLAEGRLEHTAIAAGRKVEHKATDRLRHGTTHTLVALLGATGSGKSSVTNALVGSDVATTGVRRPTTSSTLACVWGEDDATGLIDWLQVPNRHLVQGSTELDGLVLLDVPDHDSVELTHRLEMERIAAHADLLLWVSDIEKYADKAMHHYLRQLAHHGAVTVMVLNKTDRLSSEELTQVTRDLQRLLADDGLLTTRVVAVSATTGAGIEQLMAALTDAVHTQRVMIERLEADVTVVATHLSEALGTAGKREISSKVADTLSADLVEATGIEVVAAAVAAGHRRDAAAQTGWPFTRWVRRLRPHPLRRLHLGTDGQGRQSSGRTSLPAPSGAQMVRARGAIRDASDAVAEGLPAPWPSLLRRAATPDEDVLHDRLDTAVADAVRDHQARTPRWWSVVGTLQVVLAVATVVGALWLLALAVVGYLQLPAVPTPDYRGVPVPTGLLVLGALAGWLLAVLSRRLAGIGAKRRAKQTRRAAIDEVDAVVEELVLAPMRAELTDRDTLTTLISTALGS